jgi:hypothetical protein
MRRIQRAPERPLAVWMWGLALVPAAWLLLFGLFVLRARLTLGQWPIPYRPDPKDLGFDYHYAAVLAGMPITFAAVFAATLLTLLVRRQSGRDWRIPIVAIGSFAFVLLLARADPGLVFTWLAD